MKKSPNQKLLDTILAELAETLQMIENHQGPVKPFEDIVIAKGEVEMYQRFVQTMDEFCDTMQPPENAEQQMDPEKQQFLQKAREVEAESQMFQTSFAREVEKNKRKKSKKGGKDATRAAEMRERKKLYKTIGGDKKWIPL